MKKIIFIAAISCSVFTIKAQTAIGIKGGLNVSSVSVSNSLAEVNPRVSGHAGLLAHIHLSNMFAIQPELLFSGQGYQTKSNGSSGNQDVNLNYLNLPVLVQYMTNFGLRVETGPQVGVLLSARHKASTIDEDIKDNYKSGDFSWAAGVGYLHKSGFGVDARYNFGISKINDNELATNRNNVFQAGVFYQFSPGKHK